MEKLESHEQGQSHDKISRPKNDRVRVVVAHYLVTSHLALGSNCRLNCQQKLKFLGSPPAEIHLFGKQKKRNRNLVAILVPIFILIVNALL